MSLVLHRARTALLRQVPKGAEVFLSAGCAGGWFFEWVQQCYGHVERHIGLEYYAKRPDFLPINVEWIANSCSDMAAVADHSADIIFSGQNLEHLWPEEMTGFLLEAARVARPGGLLVIDSPNRAVTEALRTWSHPEHTVELTTAEAVTVTEFAGFDVVSVKGIWLGRDPNTGAILPFQFTEGQEFSLEERLVGGVEQPEDAFIWWIEARRSMRAPDSHALRECVEGIFKIAWPERLSRTSIGIGQAEVATNGEWVLCPTRTSGPVIFGPYTPLRAGHYRCTFELAAGDAGARARCDIAVGDSNVLQSREIEVGSSSTIVALDFALSKLQFGVQFRCYSLGGGGFKCRRVPKLEEFGSSASEI